MTIRDPLVYPNWLWLLGVLLLILAGVVIGLAFKSVKPHRGAGKVRVYSLGKARRIRYTGLLDEVVQRRQNGGLTEREAYLSVAALVRSAASERTHLDLESLTANEAAYTFRHWPIFAQVLKYCEQQALSQPWTEKAGSGGSGGSGGLGGFQTSGQGQHVPSEQQAQRSQTGADAVGAESVGSGTAGADAAGGAETRETGEFWSEQPGQHSQQLSPTPVPESERHPQHLQSAQLSQSTQSARSTQSTPETQPSQPAQSTQTTQPSQPLGQASTKERLDERFQEAVALARGVLG